MKKLIVATFAVIAFLVIFGGNVSAYHDDNCFFSHYDRYGRPHYRCYPYNPPPIYVPPPPVYYPPPYYPYNPPVYVPPPPVYYPPPYYPYYPYPRSLLGELLDEFVYPRHHRHRHY